MKKYVVTSLVALSVASLTGVAIGLAVNRPVQFNAESVNATQAVPSPATSDTATTQVAPATTTTTSPSTTFSPAQPTTAATTTTPAPITVTAYQQIPLDTIGNIDCEFTYSDGTTYQWHWQTINPQGSWMTDGQGQNGHWVATTDHLNICDSSAVGSTKQ